MKITLLTLISTLIFSCTIYSQVRFEELIETRVGIFTKQSIEVEGEPYLTDEWMQGTLVTNGKKTEPFLLKYNIVDNSFEIQHQNQTVIMEGAYVESATITSPDPRKLKNGFNTKGKDDLSSKTFFEVLYDGDVKLLKKDKVKLIKNVTSYGTANRRDSYSRYTDYYVVQNDEFKPIRLRERNLLNLFPDDKREIKSHIKENKLKAKNENDAGEILRFADKLTSGSDQ